MPPGNHITSPRVLSRSAQGDEDFWRVRDFLIATCTLTPPGFNWDIRRWDGMRFYESDPSLDPRWGEQIQLWETEAGRLVGAVHAEGDCGAYLQLHPDYRHIEEEMIAWAEEHLAAPSEAGQSRKLCFFVYEYDAPRRRVLKKRGYECISEAMMIRRMQFGEEPISRVEIAESYTLRNTHPHDEGDCKQIADILNAAFRRDFHNAEEYRTFTRLAPSFRPDLDLVAQAPDGSFAAYVGVPYDEANRRGIFEPVCTHPDHRRRGLARALMFEGLRRLQDIGAADVIVETGDMMPANRLYDTVGFSEIHKGFTWRRVFDKHVQALEDILKKK
jgi:ribosomal protein S18 acetylase RimI-like enzyme